MYVLYVNSYGANLRAAIRAQWLAGAAVVAASCAAQTPDKFEVISIKPSDPARDSIYVNYPNGGFIAKGMPMKILLETSFPGQLHDFQIIGAPKWFNSAKYDIEAKPDPDRQQMTGDQRTLAWDRIEVRLQALLADRFQLKVHRETREMPVYALVVAKHGPRFQQAKEPDDNPHFGFRLERGQLTAHKMSMDQFAHGILANEVSRNVLNRTGLTALYDLKLAWTPEQHPANPLAGDSDAKLPQAPAGDNGPSIFTALQDQLGLKLVPQKGPVEVLVIDRVEKPSPN